MPDEPPATLSKVEKLAQNAYMLGIASVFCGITAVPAIIQSIRALVRIRKDGANKVASRKAIFSLAFSSCILALLVFMAVSIFCAVQGIADDINCLDHMKQIGVAVRIYEMDNNDTTTRFPAPTGGAMPFSPPTMPSFIARSRPKNNVAAMQ